MGDVHMGAGFVVPHDSGVAFMHKIKSVAHSKGQDRAGTSQGVTTRKVTQPNIYGSSGQGRTHPTIPTF